MVNQNSPNTSDAILHANIDWLLNSDIRIRNGSDKGALYGWKNLNPPSFPFIYSEITGYAITCFSWINSEFKNRFALEAAEEGAKWVMRNLHSSLLYARPAVKFTNSNKLSRAYYSFDNGMVLIGLNSLYKLTKNESLLKCAEAMGQALMDRFFDGQKLVSRLDDELKPIDPEKEEGVLKWSTISGPFHCKLSIAFLELFRLTGKKEYARISDSQCNFALEFQNPDGSFITNPGSRFVYLHPHLYTCEGLIYSGMTTSSRDHLMSGLKGLAWAMNQVDLNGSRGLLRTTEKESVEQSDCNAQLLRLLILCRFELGKIVEKTRLDKVIDFLNLRLLDFYIPTGDGKGGMKYQLSNESACSWCTMFSMQALWLTSMKYRKFRWMDYFV